MQRHAQSSSNLIVDAGSIPVQKPTRIVKMILSEYEHIADIQRSESGAIFVLLINVTQPISYSLVKLDSGHFSSRLSSFTEVYGGLEVMGESLYVIEGASFSENQTSFLITVLDSQGERTSELNVTIDGGPLSPRLFTGRDGMLYLLCWNILTSSTHLIKLGTGGSILWERVVETDVPRQKEIQVSPFGEIYILKESGVELRDSAGGSRWNTTLSTNINWFPGTLHLLDDGSVIVSASYLDGFVWAGGTIYRCDSDGNVLANKTFVVSVPEEGDERIYVGDLNVRGNSIFSFVYHADKGYLLEISRDIHIVNRRLIDEGRRIQFTRDGSLVLFSENTSRYERHLVAYIYANNLLRIIAFAGGSALVLIVLAIVWRKRQVKIID
jgi:hypothetical protein